MNGKCEYIGLSIHVVCIARHCRGKNTDMQAKHRVHFIECVNIYGIRYCRTLQARPRLEHRQSAKFTHNANELHTHTHARAAMAKIECSSKCISNKADAFRLFAISQCNRTAAMRVFPHLFFVGVDGVVRALFQALIFQHYNDFTCALGVCVSVQSSTVCSVPAMHFKCFSETQWKQKNKKTQRYTFVTFRQSWRVHLSRSNQQPKTSQRINGDG